MRTKFLSIISRIVICHPWRVIITASILTLASIIFSATSLQMNTDQDDLVSENVPYHKRYKEYLGEFGDLEYLYVVVETENNMPRAKDFIRALAAKLNALPDIREVTYQISNPKLEKSFLLYLPVDQLKAVGEFLPKMERIADVAGVFGMMNDEINKISGAGATTQESPQLETGFRFLDKLLDGLTRAADDGLSYTPFLQQAFFGGDRAYDEDGFLLSENGKLLFVMIMPEKNYKTLAVIDEPLKKIRRALRDTKEEFPDVSAGLTGRPVLSADEMSISNTDMTIATIAALLIVTLIFIAYFKNPARPAMASIALVSGIIQALGLTTLIIGHLNILSVVFAVILVGAGIEFGLQIVSRYREELAAHKNVSLAIDVCITHTGRGNLTAALTTAAAFFAACFTRFLALQELGFIAGAGILICLANMFTTLPAMLYLHDRDKPPEKLRTTLHINLKRFGWFYNKPRLTIIVTTVVSAALLVGIFRIGFNHNLLDLQAKGLESVRYEKKIIEESSQSTWYVPLVASSKEESFALAEKLRVLPTIGRVETIADAVPEGQDEKIGIVRIIARNTSDKAISRNQFQEIASSASGGLAMTNELNTFKKHLSHLSELAFSAGRTDAVDELVSVSQKVERLMNLIPGHERRIEVYSFAFLTDLYHYIALLKTGLSPETITIDDMPLSIKKRYISEKTGRFSIYAYPKEDVWAPHKMEAYIKDLRSIDPNVTGTPVEVYESSRLLERSFKQAAIFAMIAIVLIVFADFRNLKFAALALTPLALGIFWLFELMGILGIKFNLANFFGIPILLGIGVDNAAQIVHRYLKDHHIESVTSIMTRSTGIAVLLTSLTTLASFLTMAFARHGGISSLGAIMALGTITCFIGSMIILPCLLKIIKTNQR